MPCLAWSGVQHVHACARAWNDVSLNVISNYTSLEGGTTHILLNDVARTWDLDYVCCVCISGHDVSVREYDEYA